MTRPRCSRSLRLLIWVLTGLTPVSTVAAAEAAKTISTPPPPPPAFSYRPPNLGAPDARIGGGTRSIRQLLALAPQHVGLTTVAQPRLYWYLSPGFRNPLRFRISAADSVAPLLEIALDPQPNGGIHYIDLAQHGVQLVPGVLYAWGVMLEPPPHQRWNKASSTGRIRLIGADRVLRGTAPEDRPYVAASQGIWYDALDGISRRVSDDAANPQWHLQRSELLAQGQLPEAAAYERQIARRQP